MKNSEKKRLKTLVFQKEASGAHFWWSGVALGGPKGGPRGYECHRRDTDSPMVGGGLPPYKSTTWWLRGSEAKKSEALRLRSEATQDLTRRWDGELFWYITLL